MKLLSGKCTSPAFETQFSKFSMARTILLFSFFWCILRDRGSPSSWRYGKVEINYVVGFSFSYMDFISLIFQRQIMKTLLSYIGFEGFFLLIRIITTINFIIVVIENLVR